MLRKFFVVLIAALAIDRSKVELQFPIWPAAQKEGVSKDVFEDALSTTTLHWSLPDLVPPGDKTETPKEQRQTEFGAPANYFRNQNLTYTTEAGREVASRNASALRHTEHTTGVPARIILGIWGRESAFGNAKTENDEFQVLATKGFMST